jgi:hypothetical protein
MDAQRQLRKRSPSSWLSHKPDLRMSAPIDRIEPFEHPQECVPPGLPTITTARLRLRARTLADLEPIVEMDAAPRVRQFIGGPSTELRTRRCGGASSRDIPSRMRPGLSNGGIIQGSSACATSVIRKKPSSRRLAGDCTPRPGGRAWRPRLRGLWSCGLLARLGCLK